MLQKFAMYLKKMSKYTLSIVLSFIITFSSAIPAFAARIEAESPEEQMPSAFDANGNQVNLDALDDPTLQEEFQEVADSVGYESDVLLPYIYEVASRAESLPDDELVSIFLNKEEDDNYRRVILETYLKKNDFTINDERFLDALEAGNLSESEEILIIAMLPGSVLDEARVLSVLYDLTNSNNETIAFHAIKAIGKVDIESAVAIAESVLQNIQNEPVAKVSASIKVLGSKYKTSALHVLNVDEENFVNELEEIYISSDDEEIRFVTLNTLRNLGSQEAADVALELEAQTPATQAMELGLGGYAAYRNGVLGGLNWHAAVIVSKSGKDVNLVHAQGSDGPVEFADYDAFLGGKTEMGYYRPSSATASFNADKRQAIANTAREIAYNRVPYVGLSPIKYYSVSSSQYYYTPDDIKSIRCDGVVEYSYEYNLIRVSGGNSNWNIARNDSSAQSAHNTLMVTPQQQAENYMVKVGEIKNW